MAHALIGETTQLGEASMAPDLSLASVEGSFRSEDERRRLASRPTQSARNPSASSSSSNTNHLAPPDTARRPSARQSSPIATPGLATSRLGKPSAVLDLTSPGDDSELLGTCPLAFSPDDSGGVETPMPRRGGKGKRKSEGAAKAGTQAMTLREQEDVIDEVKRENFSLKLKVYLLEERLSKLAPDQIDAALKENINLKMDRQTMRTELKQNRAIALKLEKTVEGLKGENGRLEAALQANQRRAAAGGGDGERWRSEAQRERGEREAAEQRALDLEAQVQDLREEMRRARSGEEWEDEEDARAEIHRLRDELDVGREEKDDLLRMQDELQAQLRETTDELLALREELDRRAPTRSEERSRRSINSYEDDPSEQLDGSVAIGAGRRQRQRAAAEREKLERRVGDLEQDKTSLQSQVEAQLNMLATRDAEREDLLDEIERLRADIVDLRRTLEERRDLDRSRSRVEEPSPDLSELERLEDERNLMRDKLAEANLELERKEAAIEELYREAEARDEEHEAELGRVAEDWQGELDDARRRNEQLEDEIGRFEEAQDEHRQEVEAAIERFQNELAEKNEELAGANEDIKRLGDQVYELENELDEAAGRVERLEAELRQADERLEEDRQVQDQVIATLKDKHAALKARHDDLEHDLDASEEELGQARARVDELSLQVAELEELRREALEKLREAEDEAEELAELLKSEKDGRERDRVHWGRERRDLDAEKARALETKEQALAGIQTELAQTRAQLAIREEDLEQVQGALRAMEAESRKLGDSHVNDRFSLELEIDRLKRDVGRYEEDLERVRTEAEAKDSLLRERDGTVEKLHAENRDLASQLATQTQTAANNLDKLESMQQLFRDGQAEVTQMRERIRELEQRLSKDQRSLITSEQQYRDQLTERNTLLLTVYQYMEKIAGPDRGAKRAGQSDAKPFTNFAVFHDNLISRLKNLSQIQLSFDKRAKDIEAGFVDKFSALRKQLDSRWKQLDRFEASLKTASETQRQWRVKATDKAKELEEMRASHSELISQVASLKARLGASSPDVSEVRSLTARATTAERRLAVAQNQLAAAEEKLEDARTKHGGSESKWAARVKEYESRLRAAEEKYKRERQGAKERVSDLESSIAMLEKQIEGANRRNATLQGVLKTNGIAPS